jgi:hypothetical protein
MPNGELTRFAEWPLFWSRVASSMAQGGGVLGSVRKADAKSFFDPKLFGGKANSSEFSLFLNPSTLAWEEAWTAESHLRAGVYTSPSTNEFIFFDFPEEEFASDFLSPEAFEHSWKEADSPVGASERIHKERRLLPFLGALLALVSLLFLWSARRRAVLGVFPFFLLWNVENSAEAQSFSQRSVQNVETVPFRIAWCGGEPSPAIAERYAELRELLARRGTIRLPKSLIGGACRLGEAEFWWTNNPSALKISDTRAHIAAGGFVLVEGFGGQGVESALGALENPSVGLFWENPPKRGMFYRSFYLLHSFDGCTEDKTWVLQLRKKVNASAPMALVTSARFLGVGSGSDCFGSNEDYRTRTFVNLFYAVLTTDYKEDHMRLPELLNRVRNLGLEP